MTTPSCSGQCSGCGHDSFCNRIRRTTDTSFLGKERDVIARLREEASLAHQYEEATELASRLAVAEARLAELADQPDERS